jgi:16S rRNA (cytosine967-C5)-methyltransferase
VTGVQTCALPICSAPGGKTAHLLEAHDLALAALDSDARRLARVAENCARLGLGAELRHADAGRPADWWDGRDYDRILLDAPCTASGVVRRHPDGRWLKRSEDATHLAAEQARLLDAVWPLLRRGGKLLYATCSLFQEENTEQAEHFLRRHSDARREALTLPGGHAGQLLPSSDHDGFFYARFVKT